MRVPGSRCSHTFHKFSKIFEHWERRNEYGFLRLVKIWVTHSPPLFYTYYQKWKGFTFYQERHVRPRKECDRPENGERKGHFMTHGTRARITIVNKCSIPPHADDAQEYRAGQSAAEQYMPSENFFDGYDFMRLAGCLVKAARFRHKIRHATWCFTRRNMQWPAGAYGQYGAKTAFSTTSLFHRHPALPRAWKRFSFAMAYIRWHAHRRPPTMHIYRYML